MSSDNEVAADRFVSLKQSEMHLR